MIFCLIWLLSYEGSISNPFLVWGNISAGRAVILVLLHSTTRVVEKVVVQFIHFSFVNALNRISIQSFQISSQGPLLHSFRLLQLLGMIKSDSNFWSFMFFSSWWTSASGDLASDEVLLMNLLLMTSSLQKRFVLHEHFSSDASSFLFLDSFALFCSSRTL